MSLTSRIALSATVVLITFVVLTGATLDKAFYESAKSAIQERQLGQLYLLMAAAEVDQQGTLAMPNRLTEARLNLPESGLYAKITGKNTTTLWQSPSSVNIDYTHSSYLVAGKQQFELTENQNGQSYFILSFGINWETSKGIFPFVFSIAEDLVAFNVQIWRYRKSLWGWLATMSVILLLSQAILLRWGLNPLRQVAAELTLIESGEINNLEGHYPKELQKLTDNINTLMQHERSQQKRYRNSLADLAHSLKTPLAVLKTAATENLSADKIKAILDQQISLMDKIVQYQLQKGATSGATRLSTLIEVEPIINKIVNSLNKVHRNKSVKVDLEKDKTCRFRGHEGDLLEILGNVIDNAYKWCNSRITIKSNNEASSLILVIQDDGPGFDEDQIKLILQRGYRADQKMPGHGIGLAIVQDIVDAYNGNISLNRSPMGGAEVKLQFNVS